MVRFYLSLIWLLLIIMDLFGIFLICLEKFSSENEIILDMAHYHEEEEEVNKIFSFLSYF